MPQHSASSVTSNLNLRRPSLLFFCSVLRFLIITNIICHRFLNADTTTKYPTEWLVESINNKAQYDS
jgi:hypothetical protein